MARTMTETQLHRAVASFMSIALPAAAVWTTFPAGGGGKVRGAMLKAAGLRAGWPDIQVLYKGRLSCLELKTKDGVLSNDQRACHRDLTKAGAEVFICRSVDDVCLALQCAGIPLRATAFGLGTRRTAA